MFIAACLQGAPIETTMSSRSLTCSGRHSGFASAGTSDHYDFPLCLEPKDKTAHNFGVGLKGGSIEKRCSSPKMAIYYITFFGPGLM
jgi:hypothetical protein